MNSPEVVTRAFAEQSTVTAAGRHSRTRNSFRDLALRSPAHHPAATAEVRDGS